MKIPLWSPFKDNKRSSEINQITELIKNISERYFGDLVKLRADSGQSSNTPTEERLVDLKRQYSNWLGEGIVKYMKEQHLSRSTNTSQAGEDQVKIAAEELVVFFYEIRKGMMFDQFREILDALFNPEILDAQFNPRKNPNARFLLTGDKEIPQCIAWVIQDIVIKTPQIISKDSNALRDSRVKDCLIVILTYLDSLQQKFIQVANDRGRPIKGKRPRAKDIAETDLERQFALARVDKDVPLPLKMDNNLSLSKVKPEDYSRKKAEVDGLVKLILKSNGVMLVTGYDEVGKSAFIDAVLSKLPTSPEMQDRADSVFWQVLLPISVKLQVLTSVLDVLRECICKMYSALEEKSIIILLNNEERERLNLANERANSDYKVHRSDKVTKELEYKLSGENPTSLLGKLVPDFIKINSFWRKNRAKTVESTADSLSYNERQAKEDILYLINFLAKPRSTGRGEVKIKFAFIFDEIKDLKMDKKELLGQLIYLCKSQDREGDAVFLFVVSYDQWPEELDYGHKSVVPLFTAEEMDRLLKGLISLSPKELTQQDDEFIHIFASFLTYAAKGIPTKILSELQVKVKEYKIVASPNDKLLFHVYAQIQRAIENSMLLDLNLGTAPVKNTSLEERRDRIQWVLYEKIFGELLDDESKGNLNLVQSNSKKYLGSPELKYIFENNFKLFLSPDDFYDLVVKLAKRLKEIKIGRYNIFLLEENKGKYKTLKVLPYFRDLLSSYQRQQTNQRIEVLPNLTQIEGFLNEKETRQQALNYIEQYRREEESKIPDSIYTSLYGIFVRNEDFGNEAARYLNGSVFFLNAKKTKELLDKFIEQETDEQLLREFIRLIEEGTKDSENLQDGIAFLLKLLNREVPNRRLSLPLPIMIAAISLLVEIRDAAISLLVEICDKDILEQVVKSLDKNLDRRQDINEEYVLKPLIALSIQSEKNLITLLFKHGFTAISQKNLKTLLSEQNDSQKQELWSFISNAKNRKDKFAGQIMRVISRYLPGLDSAQHENLAVALKNITSQGDKFAGQIMVAILQELPGLDSTKREDLEKAVLDWLKSPHWEPAVDQVALRIAVYGNSQMDIDGNIDLPHTLRTLAQQPEYQKAHERLDTTFPPVTSITNPSPGTSKKEKLIKLIGGIAAIAFLAVYFVTPFDLPAHVIFSSWLIARSLEAIYVSGAFLGIICLLKAIRRWNRSLERRSMKVYSMLALALLTIAVVCFRLQIFLFPLRFTFLGQLILIGLLLPIYLVLYVAMSSKIDNFWHSLISNSGREEHADGGGSGA